MSARADILSTIRRSLGVTGQEAPRKMAVAQRLEQAPRGVVPARGQLPHAAQIDLFTQQAVAAAASVARVSQPADVPHEIARYLRDANLPASIKMGQDPRLTAMPWSETNLEASTGPSRGDDLNGVSHAFGGVAETGTLVVASGAENPSTLNFLPDNHIVVINGADIAGDYETVLAGARKAYGKGMMPRTLNMITGPSRSGDIEQTILLGAHGPRSLHIVIVGDFQ